MNIDTMLLLIHEALPYVGMVMVLIAIFFRKLYTKGTIISSILHSYLIVFMLQIWVDANHDMLTLSTSQLLVERVLLLVILLMTIIFSCRMKKIQSKIKRQLAHGEFQLRRLRTTNEHLRSQLKS